MLTLSTTLSASTRAQHALGSAYHTEEHGFERAGLGLVLSTGSLHVQVRPLRRQLTGLKAWITGQRKDQSPGTRAAVPVVQVDPVFEGLEGGPGSLVKFNPLSNVSSAEVWNFLRIMVRS